MVICLFGSLEYSPESKFIEEEIKLSDIKLPNCSSVNPLFLALLYSSEANLNKFLVNNCIFSSFTSDGISFSNISLTIVFISIFPPDLVLIESANDSTSGLGFTNKLFISSALFIFSESLW